MTKFPISCRALAVSLALTMVLNPAVHSAESIRGDFAERPTEPVIERGWKILPLDLIARLFALPNELLLWNHKLQNRNVSEETLEDLRQYMIYYQLEDVKVRVNKAAFVDEYRRLFTNKKMHWAIRIPFGFLTTTISLITERILAGDYYNPFNDTIHIFSDITPVVVHEAGHARDFDRQSNRGFYALMRIVPGMDLIQEDEASSSAIKYFIEKGDHATEIEAYKILYPAYGSYIGSYFGFILPFSIGSIGAILGGHWFGRHKAREVSQKYRLSEEKLRYQDQQIQRQKALHTKNSPLPSATSL
ncbi:MAG TPA: hypothetical protein VL688_06090 [Verrucomicrobiae bacterium]|nr:hypothetical protein [Verrucomicrobiae bacterium]